MYVCDLKIFEHVHKFVIKSCVSGLNIIWPIINHDNESDSEKTCFYP